MRTKDIQSGHALVHGAPGILERDHDRQRSGCLCGNSYGWRSENIGSSQNPGLPQHRVSGPLRFGVGPPSESVAPCPPIWRTERRRLHHKVEPLKGTPSERNIRQRKDPRNPNGLTFDYPRKKPLVRLTQVRSIGDSALEHFPWGRPVYTRSSKGVFFRLPVKGKWAHPFETGRRVPATSSISIHQINEPAQSL